MLDIILQAVAVAATALAWIPQFVLILRRRDLAGLSTSSWALGGATGLVFALYGLRTHVWSLTASEGLFALGALVITAFLVKPGRLAVSLPPVAGAAYLLSLCPGVIIGVVGFIGSLLMRVLQIHRARQSPSTSGISATSWLLLTLNCSAWGFYGALTNHWPLTATSVMVLAASLILVLQVRVLRQKG